MNHRVEERLTDTLRDYVHLRIRMFVYRGLNRVWGIDVYGVYHHRYVRPCLPLTCEGLSIVVMHNKCSINKGCLNHFVLKQWKLLPFCILLGTILCPFMSSTFGRDANDKIATDCRKKDQTQPNGSQSDNTQINSLLTSTAQRSPEASHKRAFLGETQ